MDEPQGTTADREAADKSRDGVRWIPAVATIVLVLITLLGWWGASRREEDRIEALIAVEADRASSHVRIHLDALIENLERTALRWGGTAGLTEQGASVESSLLLRDPAISSVLWLDTELELLWALGPDASPVPGQVEEWMRSVDEPGWLQALERQRLVVSEGLTGPGGVASFLVHVPLIVASGPAGVMVAVVDIDEWARRVGMDLAGPMEMQITPAGLEAGAATSEFRARWAVHRDVSRGDLRLHVVVWPAEATLVSLRSSLPETVLVGGIAFAMLLGLAVRLGQVEGLRRRDARMAAMLAREVEARRRAEADLAARARALERSNDDLLQFARVLSHDLRDPLNVVSMHLQLLSEAGSDPDDVRRHATKARKATENMVQMIEGLLEYSRVGGAEEGEEFNAREAVEQALTNLESAITETGTEVTVDDLPVVVGSPDQLALVFQNLIGNAVRHRREARPRIRVKCEARDEHWLFRVADNGPGIPPDAAEGIFRLFQSAGPSGGSGMGLAICRRVIESYGGRIWVRSSPGEGTTFYFTWPRRGDAPAAS